MIPLRDASPARGSPAVTLVIAGLCVVGFGYELWVAASGGDAALDGPLAPGATMTQLFAPADPRPGRSDGSSDLAGAAEQEHTTRTHVTRTVRRII